MTLFEEQPAAVDFETLWTKVLATRRERETLPATEDEGRRSLRVSLLQLFLSDLVQLHVRPP